MTNVKGLKKALSRIVFGAINMDSRKQEESFAVLDAAMDYGINGIDTANVYAGGYSERCLGRWMEARGNREDVVILSKGCHHNQDRKRVTPFDLASDLFDALARLRTDYVDLYMLHRDDPDLPVGPIVEAFNEHLEAERIHAYGVSNWTLPRIKEAITYANDHGLVPLAANSPNYSLAEQVENPWGPGCVSLSGPSFTAERAWHLENDMPVFAYSSIGRGLFSGRINRENYRDVADGACQRAYCYEVNFARLDRVTEMAQQKGITVAQLALAYVLTDPMPVYALVGAANREEIAQCVAAMDIELTDAERTWLDTGD